MMILFSCSTHSYSDYGFVGCMCLNVVYAVVVVLFDALAMMRVLESTAGWHGLN